MTEEKKEITTPKAERPKNALSQKEQSKVKPFVLGITAIVVFGILFGGGWYLQNGVKNVSESNVVYRYAKTFGIDMAKVNGRGVSYAEFIEDVRALRQFYSSQEDAPPVTDDDVHSQAFSRLAINQIIDSVSAELNVEVTNENIEAVRQELLGQYGSEEEASKELMKRYGWTLKEYERRIIIPYVHEQQLRETFENAGEGEFTEYATGEEIRARHILFSISPDIDEEAEAEIKAEAEAVLTRIKGGEDFAALAAEYGSDGTASNGGDLGWFGKGQMVPQFENAVFSLEPGQVSEELVKTDFGYHIVQVDEKRVGRDFIQFMDEQVRNANIELLVNINNPFSLPEAGVQ